MSIYVGKVEIAQANLFQTIKSFLAQTFAALTTIVVLVACTIGAAQAQSISISSQEDDRAKAVAVRLNESIVVRVDRDISEVLLGSEDVAKVSVRSSRIVVVTGVGLGSATVALLSDSSDIISTLKVTVRRDVDGLNLLLSRLFPKNSISIEAVGTGLMISGSVDNPSVAERVVDVVAKFTGDDSQIYNGLTSIGKKQVSLKLTIAEVSRSMLKQLGVNLFSGADAIYGTGRVGNSVNSFYQTNPNIDPSGSILGVSILGSHPITAVVRALESNDLARVMADTTVTVISGETGQFMVGGEYPILTSIEEDREIYSYKDIGVSVGYTPTIINAGRISMKIKAVSSEISETSLNGLNGITTRRAETTVEIPSGGSMVIGGMFKETSRQVVDGAPWLMDIPVLGNFFKSRQLNTQQTELVVIATPYIVKPTVRDRIAVPGEGYKVSSFGESLATGRVNYPAKALKRNYGYSDY